jgi:hypothetical protein
MGLWRFRGIANGWPPQRETQFPPPGAVAPPTPVAYHWAGTRDALNKPSPQRKLGTMLLFAMDSSFRWNDENRLVQSFPRLVWPSCMVRVEGSRYLLNEGSTSYLQPRDELPARHWTFAHCEAGESTHRLRNNQSIAIWRTHMSIKEIWHKLDDDMQKRFHATSSRLIFREAIVVAGMFYAHGYLKRNIHPNSHGALDKAWYGSLAPHHPLHTLRVSVQDT